MGKYPLSDKEKKRIIDLLENEHPSKREVFMKNAANFAQWLAGACYDIWCKFITRRFSIMKHIQTIETRNLCESAKNGGCGECQTSCQSACKTSCGIANQQCENTEK